MTPIPAVAERQIDPFYVMEIMARAQQREAQGRTIQHLEVGELDYCAHPAIINSAIESLRDGRAGYTRSLGAADLRDAVAARYSSDGVALDASQVLISTGTSPILFIALACVADVNDEIILFDPGYPCYPNFARLLGCRVRYCSLRPENGFRPDPKAVEQLVGPRTRAIVFCSPANPTGVVLSSDEIAELADLGPWVICDEIYREIEFTPEPSPSALTLGRDNLIVVDGFSKKYAMTGFRLGYGVFPAALTNKAESIHQSLMISASPFVQAAGLTALNEAGADVERELWRAELQQRRDQMLSGLSRLGIDVPAKTDGAFYLLADFRRYGESSLALATEILNTVDVATTPGLDFGVQSEGFLRLSFAKSADTITQGLAGIERWLARQ